MWTIGGWLNYGERRYGEMYKAVAETTGCSEEMVRLDQRGVNGRATPSLVLVVVNLTDKLEAINALIDLTPSG